MSHSMSGSSMQASSRRSQTPASRHRMNRRCVLLHPPYSGGKSRHGAPVRKIQKTALTNFRLSLAIPPHVPRLPGRCGSIFDHIASERSWRWRALFLLVLWLVFMPFSFTKTGASCNTNLVTTHSSIDPRKSALFTLGERAEGGNEIFREIGGEGGAFGGGRDGGGCDGG